MTEGMDPYRKLKGAVHEALSQIGIDPLQFQIHVGGGPDGTEDGDDETVVIVGRINRDVLTTSQAVSDEQKAIDDQFAEMMRAQREAELQAQHEEAARQAAELAAKLEAEEDEAVQNMRRLLGQ